MVEVFSRIAESLGKLHAGIFGRLAGLFSKKQEIRLGIYGSPNAGKTTLANIICMDFLGEEMGSVSSVAHETREIQMKENITLKRDGKELTINLIDTPGIATKIDFEDFMGKKIGFLEEDAKQRAKEATRGVIEAIKWLDEMDVVIAIMDSTLDPYTQVNVTILGNLEAREIPAMIIANKTDLKKANVKRVTNAFPQYRVVGISAKTRDGLDDFYDAVFEIAEDFRKSKGKRKKTKRKNRRD